MGQAGLDFLMQPASRENKMRRLPELRFVAVAVVVAACSGGVSAQQLTGELGLAQRHDHAERAATAAARSQVRRRDQGEGLGVHPVVGAARRAAEGCAQRAADHDRRCRLRRAGDVRRGRSDSGPGPHRQQRAALHELSLDLAVLADAGGADHRSQSPCRRLWGGGRDRHGLSRATIRSSCAPTAPSAPS